MRDKDANLILPYVLKSIKQLELAKADFIVLPCNTLHSLLPTLRNNSKLKVFDLIEEASKKIKQDYKKIGILCTTKTRKEGLYDAHLKNVEIVYPNEKEQEELSKIIVRIIRKEATFKDREYLEDLIKKLMALGAEKVVLACTDLANLTRENINVIDSTQILIDSVIEKMNKE